MTQEQQTIWNYLTTNCVGINNAQNVATIAQGCDYAPHGTNNDNFRAIVTNMVVNEGLPIGSCQKGYFVITTEEERQKAINWIDRNKKVEALQRVQLYQP